MHGWQANQRAHLRYASEQGLCPKMKNHPLCGWMIIVLYALEYKKYCCRRINFQLVCQAASAHSE